MGPGLCCVASEVITTPGLIFVRKLAVLVHSLFFERKMG